MTDLYGGEPVTAYRCIAADPPWLERGAGKSKRGADRHYRLLNKKQIVEVMRSAPVWRPAADCHLWLWATSNFLRDALWVMEVLGFRYVTNAVWSKMVHGRLQIGLGQYLRHAHELLLLGVRGRPPVPEPADRMPSVIIAPRTKHSAKPAEAFELIERVSPGPRVEMFARAPRENWTVWGNEV